MKENLVGSDRAHENLPGDETDSWKPNEECKNLVENFVPADGWHEN